MSIDIQYNIRPKKNKDLTCGANLIIRSIKILCNKIQFV